MAPVKAAWTHLWSPGCPGPCMVPEKSRVDVLATGVYGTHRSPRASLRECMGLTAARERLVFGQYMKLLRTPPEITRPRDPSVWGAPDPLGLGYSLSPAGWASEAPATWLATWLPVGR